MLNKFFFLPSSSPVPAAGDGAGCGRRRAWPAGVRGPRRRAWPAGVRGPRRRAWLAGASSTRASGRVAARGAGGASGDAGLAGASGGRARVPAARGRIWGKRERKEE